MPVLEPYIGGRYEISMHLANGQVVPVSGVFKRVERPQQLVFPGGWNGDPLRQSLISISFSAHGAAAQRVLREEGLGTVSNRDDQAKGSNSTPNKLVGCRGHAHYPEIWRGEQPPEDRSFAHDN